MMQARIQYIAIRSEQPEVLAEFYKHYFKMSEIDSTASGNIALTDGFYNVSLLKCEVDDRTSGFSHFGVAIDDLHELVVRIEKFAPPQTRLLAEPGGSCYGEYRVYDPNGVPVSISTSSFGIREDQSRLPAIRHLALSVSNNQVALEFYMNLFGFRQQVNADAKSIRFQGIHTSRGAADGTTAFQLLRFPVTTSDVDPSVKLGPRHTRWGVNHMGWLVADVDALLKELPEGTVHQRPSARPMAEYRGYDPDFNEFDISFAKGYQVDEKVWAKG